MIKKTLTDPKDNSFVKKTCDSCEVEYWEKKYSAFRYKKSFCSNPCHWESLKTSQRFSNNPFWKGGRIIRKGYVQIKLGKGEPGTDSQGYIREHHLVMMKKIGRLINKNEEVHHKNKIKDDNRIENLMLLTKAEHSRLHNPLGHKKSEETKEKMRIATAKRPWTFKKGFKPWNTGMSKEDMKNYRSHKIRSEANDERPNGHRKWWQKQEKNEE